MNPSFLPPPPVSQKYRQAMWDLHIQDPQKYNLRFLSQHFGLTLERAHAVLRLKALEAEMTARVSGDAFEVRAAPRAGRNDEQQNYFRLVLKTHNVVTILFIRFTF